MRPPKVPLGRHPRHLAHLKVPPEKGRKTTIPQYIATAGVKNVREKTRAERHSQVLYTQDGSSFMSVYLLVLASYKFPETRSSYRVFSRFALERNSFVVACTPPLFLSGKLRSAISTSPWFDQFLFLSLRSSNGVVQDSGTAFLFLSRVTSEESALFLFFFFLLRVVFHGVKI